MKVYANFTEMIRHLRGNVETIIPKEYEGKAEKPSSSSEKKKRSRKKKEE